MMTTIEIQAAHRRETRNHRWALFAVAATAFAVMAIGITSYFVPPMALLP